MIITDNITTKSCTAPDFNYKFDKITGYHEQWGVTKEDDSTRSYYGPVIADIEILNMCKGPGARENKKGDLCTFCYKSNNPVGEYMTLESFKTIFNKLPRTLTQIAFGADADASLNPDLFQMMDYCRNNMYNEVIPNITVADISASTATELIKRTGAVAVSWYGMHSDKNYCYDTIDLLSKASIKETRILVHRTDMKVIRKLKPQEKYSCSKEEAVFSLEQLMSLFTLPETKMNLFKKYGTQINIHFMLSAETQEHVDELIQDIKTDERLQYLNAVVFLSLKQKGRGTSFKGCSKDEFKIVIDKMFSENIAFGFDSCSAVKFLEASKDRDNYEELKMLAEPCESFSQSIYINESGDVVPCSFMENVNWNLLDYSKYYKWNLLDSTIKDSEEFLTKIWNSNEAISFSNNATQCQSCGQGCQVYEI